VVLGEHREGGLPRGVITTSIENKGHGRLPGLPWPFYFCFYKQNEFEKAVDKKSIAFLF
jgi:hypothetical protein